MFKALGNFIYRTPWWALILFGSSVLLLLGILVTPFHVLNLQQKGVDRAQKQAIQREIDSSLGQSLLGVAEEFVKGIHDSSNDPARRAELERALKEILRARRELENARADIQSSTRDAVKEARDAAREIAIAAAENAYEAAVAARERVAEAQEDIRAALKSSNIPQTEWPKSLDEKLEQARQAEKHAKQALATVRAKLDQGDHSLSLTIGPDRAARESTPDGAGNAPAAPEQQPPAVAPLPPELRQDIRVKVASAVYRATVGSLLILLFIPIFIMIVIAKVFIGRARRSQDVAEARKREAEYHNFNRQLTEAKLKVLQAQVEPHFLFNTLANVQALTEVDPGAANEMVGHLIQYLRSSLPRMRQTVSSVAQEIELVAAYLNILKMRMGERLSFTIDVSEAARSVSFPPMMLPSLVENAIKHGLEPQREGGTIEIVAKVLGTRLLMSVADTGRGLVSGGETVGGVGLTNIRERLAALYGDAASLKLEERPAKGVTATISLPLGGGTAAADGTGDGAGKHAGAASVAAAQGTKGGSRLWSTVSSTHRLWGRVLSSTFVALMILFAVIFGIAWAALLAGILPLNINHVEIGGIEGMALGSLLLVAGFGALALALLVVVGVIYGLGLLLTGLLIFIPAVIIVAMFPALAPLILIGLLIYWFVGRRKRRRAAAAAKAKSRAGE